MGLLRSEEMRRGMLVLPVQDARRYIDKIGKEISIQFDDMNAREMRRPYRKHIQRIDEMERILRFMFEEIGRIEGCEIEQNKVEEFLAADGSYKLEEVEGELQQLYAQFTKFKENNSVLINERNAAVEESEVISAAMKILGSGASTNDLSRPILEGDALSERRLGYVAGTVLKTDETRFARALWRASRGNTFTQFSPIEESVIDPKTGAKVEKSVFVVYFQGSVGSMKEKIVKVCAAFGVNQYAWPASPDQARGRDAQLKTQLREKKAALEAYNNLMRTEARDLVAPSPVNRLGNSKLEDWRLFCIKEKSIYNVLNHCEEGMALRVSVWYPAADEAKIQALLKDERKGNDGQGAFLNPDRGATKSTIPTYIRTNEFTEPWQVLTNTIGVPRYQEANPTLFSVVTFPFIFGMMYGDIGHGTLLLLAGIWLCRNAESLRFTQPELYAARYMVVSLGIFAVYAGFLYNDMFSVSLQLFDSGFKPDGDDKVNWVPDFDVTNSGGPGPYPFGLDWAWANASNELLFVNSLKMKLSVLFGVIQMTVGLVLRWSNAFYEKNLTDFIFECIPMMVFMMCFFGWMDFMIMYKWVYPVDNPPSIINSLICMAMGQEDLNPLWAGSVELAQTLMKLTVLTVPLMLFPKPFILLWQHKQAEKKKQQGHELLQDEESQHGPMDAHGHGEEFEFDEIFIHQVIETIEYVLGTVSHTASYLRIWALSLAHQQLSLVFFQKTLSMGLTMAFPYNGIMIYFMFAAWFGITLGVLLGMDVLECFLHTLRLHWIEFQSKFYKAKGEEFAPYSVRKLIDAASD